jgi:uncharacterized alkaline shock family protein YloU
VGRGIVGAVVRLAALEMPGVRRIGRGGAAWRAWLRGAPVVVRMDDGRVEVHLWIVARPNADVRDLAAQVRRTVRAAVERLLGLEVSSVSVVVDGIGS